MSYCRFSSDDFACDLYCYASAEGFTTHVAGSRIVGTVPASLPFPETEDTNAPEWVAWRERQAEQSVFLHSAQREPIGLPHDGKTFVDDDLDSFRARLLSLREAGYRFPDHVFDQIDADAAS